LKEASASSNSRAAYQLFLKTGSAFFSPKIFFAQKKDALRAPPLLSFYLLKKKPVWGGDF